MLIKTTRFGEIEIAEEEVVHFPDGILGFEKIHDYVIISQGEEDLLKWLQAVTEPGLAFIIIKPEEFLFSYELDIPEEDVKFLDLKKPEDVLIFAIVTVPDDPRQMTANLQGPLIINKTNRQARQVIISDGRFKVKHFILKEMQDRGKKLAALKDNKKPAPGHNSDGGNK
tara:strand:+ start:178 stop:687 length:510 start_codon:yes stop_codon:yes gene_type:complete